MWQILKNLLTKNKKSLDDSQIMGASIMNDIKKGLEEKNPALIKGSIDTLWEDPNILSNFKEKNESPNYSGEVLYKAAQLLFSKPTFSSDINSSLNTNIIKFIFLSKAMLKPTYEYGLGQAIKKHDDSAAKNLIKINTPPQMAWSDLKTMYATSKSLILSEEEVNHQFSKLSCYYHDNSYDSSRPLITSEEKVNNHFSKLMSFYKENAYAFYMLGENFEQKLGEGFDKSDEI